MGVSLAEAFNDTFTAFGVVLITACAVWFVWHWVRVYIGRGFW